MSPQSQPDDASRAASSHLEVERLRAEIEQLREQLRIEKTGAGERVRELTYAISHDLKEPLRMITSYAQLLERRCQDQLDKDGREFMAYIQDAAKRMDQLLADLSAYSNQFRTDDKPLPVVDSEGALVGAMLNLDKQIQEGGAKITYDAMPSLPFDFAQLTMLFRQLLSNSLKFRGTEPPLVHVSVSDQPDQIVFSVRDNGIGIDPRYHQQIFAMFKRLHGREYPGTGMGLAICHRIVEQRGGKIWVESQPGQGATFQFSIPR